MRPLSTTRPIHVSGHLRCQAIKPTARTTTAGSASWSRTEVAHVGTHGIRHRAATDITNPVFPIKVGMALTAHKTVTQFMAYVHAEDDRCGPLPSWWPPCAGAPSTRPGPGCADTSGARLRFWRSRMAKKTRASQGQLSPVSPSQESNRALCRPARNPGRIAVNEGRRKRPSRELQGRPACRRLFTTTRPRRFWADSSLTKSRTCTRIIGTTWPV